MTKREREEKEEGRPESGVGRQAPAQSEKSPVREKRGRGQGRGGRRGRRELPTIVRRLQVFLPDSRLTARVGRGRAGLHPLPLEHLGAKGWEEWYLKTQSRKGYPRLRLSKKARPCSSRWVWEGSTQSSPSPLPYTDISSVSTHLEPIPRPSLSLAITWLPSPVVQSSLCQMVHCPPGCKDRVCICDFRISLYRAALDFSFLDSLLLLVPGGHSCALNSLEEVVCLGDRPGLCSVVGSG